MSTVKAILSVLFSLGLGCLIHIHNATAEVPPAQSQKPTEVPPPQANNDKPKNHLCAEGEVWKENKCIQIHVVKPKEINSSTALPDEPTPPRLFIPAR